MNEFSRIDGVADAVGIVQERSHSGRNGAGRNGHAALEEMRDEVAEGLLYSHSRANANTNKTLEVASFAYALIELLAERGIISIEELDERKKIVGQRLVEKFVEKGMGVALTKDEGDKYAYQSETRIDCENRIHLCQAACCRLRFALSVQDVEEGIVKWDLGHPYMIRHTPDGYCHHLERGTCRCTIYQQRPVVCRSYDCRRDERIWLDFEEKIINPELDSIFQPPAQAGSNGHAAGHHSEDG
jgi:Fe-S-cluster containining protein